MNQSQSMSQVTNQVTSQVTNQHLSHTVAETHTEEEWNPMEELVITFKPFLSTLDHD